MENDLGGAKKNDKLFHTKYGEGVVVETIEGAVDKSIQLKFDSHNAMIDKNLWIYSNGKENISDYYPSVFWGDPHINYPPKPKRKVEKIIEKWLNFYPADDISDGKVRFYSYETKEEADEACHKEARLGEACRVIHKYTVEE